MGRLWLRFQRLTDAARFFEILSNPRFTHLPARPKTIGEEIAFLRENAGKRREKREYHYAILHDDAVIGAIGLAINGRTDFIGEIGYFIDETYWGRGFAAEAVSLIERIGFDTLRLHRLEIVVSPENEASVRVAEKCGYAFEGLLRDRIRIGDAYHDAYLYAKVKDGR